MTRVRTCRSAAEGRADMLMRTSRQPQEMSPPPTLQIKNLSDSRTGAQRRAANSDAKTGPRAETPTGGGQIQTCPTVDQVLAESSSRRASRGAAVVRDFVRADARMGHGHTCPPRRGCRKTCPTIGQVRAESIGRTVLAETQRWAVTWCLFERRGRQWAVPPPGARSGNLSDSQTGSRRMNRGRSPHGEHRWTTMSCV